MRRTRLLAAAFALLTLTGHAFTGSAQTAQPKPELLLFHPSGPPLSYEVATVKPVDSKSADQMVMLPPGATLNPLSIRRYIMDAYGATYQAQVVGGPDWLNKGPYNIKGKFPDDLEAAYQKMTSDARHDQDRAMQQSLLADRFHLKAHFETRVLPVYELVPAKGGLKITEVPAPPERKPGDPPIPIRFHIGDTAASRNDDDHDEQQRPLRLQRPRHQNAVAGPRHQFLRRRRNRRSSHRRPHRLHRLL